MNCCHGQLAKNISQTIEIGKAETLRLDVPDAKILWRTTKEKRIIIETTIELSVPNEALLNFIINNGRYELLSQTNERTKKMVLYSKRKRNILIVKGEECKERVIYTIFVPPSLRSSTQ